jgi:hypothetical protein
MAAGQHPCLMIPDAFSVEKNEGTVTESEVI